MKLIALVLVAALNPLVVRSPEPHGNIPANCETSDAAPMPRALIADAGGGADDSEATVPLPPIVPKRTTTATASRFDNAAINAAIARNDRAAFDAELARAREAGASTRVYDDVAKLWDAQFESPYFAADSAPHRIAAQYQGYEAAVASQVFTDQAGRKFYPAAESRQFVARQAGVKTGTTQPQPQTATPRNTTTRQPDNQTTRKPSNPATQQPSNQTTPRTTPPKTTTTRATPQPRNPATPKSTTPATRNPTPPSPSPDPSAAKRNDVAVPAPVVPQVGDTSSTEASPAAGSLPTDIAATGTAGDTMATDTTATDAMATDTTVTDTTDTTASTTTTAAPAKGRSIVIPAILILIGLGVLILLFKAR